MGVGEGVGSGVGVGVTIERAEGVSEGVVVGVTVGVAVGVMPPVLSGNRGVMMGWERRSVASNRPEGSMSAMPLGKREVTELRLASSCCTAEVPSDSVWEVVGVRVAAEREDDRSAAAGSAVVVGAVVAWVGLPPSAAAGVVVVGAEPSGVNQGRIAIVAVGVKAKTAEPDDPGFWVVGVEVGAGAEALAAAVAAAEALAAVTAAAAAVAVAVAAATAAGTSVVVGICWRVKRGRRVD